jgi:hypothetical protein
MITYRLSGIFYSFVIVLTCLFLNIPSVWSSPTVEVEFYSCPSQIDVGQLVDIRVRVRLNGLDSNGPWKVIELALRDQDIAGTYETIRNVSYPISLTELDKWEYYTFSDIDLSKWSDNDNGVDDVELYVNAKVDDNIGNGYWLPAKSAINKVIVAQPIKLVDLQIIGSASANSGQNVYYTAKAFYSDGSNKMVTYGCVWDIETKNYANISSNAKLSVATGFSDNQFIQIFASYTESGITIHAEKSVQLIGDQNPISGTFSISPLVQYIPATTGKVFFSLASMTKTSSPQWDASLDENCDWASIQSSVETNNGIIQVTFEQNRQVQRQCVITLKSDNATIGSFQIIQAGPLDSLDVNKDSTIDLKDMLNILKYLSGE